MDFNRSLHFKPFSHLIAICQMMPFYFSTILDYLGIKPPPDPKRVGRSYAAFVKGQSPR